MKNGRFHKDLGLPAGALAPFLGCVCLTYSYHAKRALLDDYTPGLRAPHTIQILAADVVEVVIENGRPLQAVVRTPLDSFRDLVLVVFAPERSGVALVKTCWINQRDDKHSTLDASQYSKP